MKKALISIFLIVSLLLVSLSGCSFFAQKAAENAAKDAASKAGITYDDKKGNVTVSTESGTAQMGENVEWPKGWPSDLPKLEGTVTTVIDTGIEKGGGIEIALKVSGSDAVKKYAKQFESMSGYSKLFETSADSSYSVGYSSSKYTISISLSNSNEVLIILGAGEKNSSSDSQ